MQACALASRLHCKPQVATYRTALLLRQAIGNDKDSSVVITITIMDTALRSCARKDVRQTRTACNAQHKLALYVYSYLYIYKLIFAQHSSKNSANLQRAKVSTI